MLKIKGLYDFLIFLGFKEENYNNNLTLYLSNYNTNLSKLEKALYYMNLLHLNFIDINNADNINYFETPSQPDSLPKNNINSSNNITNNINKKEIEKINEPNSIIERHEDNLNEAQNILKETGKERYKRALNYSNDNSGCFSNFFNFFTC